MADDPSKTSKRRKTGGTKAPARKARASKAGGSGPHRAAGGKAPARKAPASKPPTRTEPAGQAPASRTQAAKPPAGKPAGRVQASPADPLADFFYSPDEGGTPGGLVPASAEAGATAGEDGVPDREADAAVEAEVEYLSFWLADELYAVPIAALREIVRPLPITDVPRTPPWILGVVTLRGTVLPVFDLRLRLGLPVRETGRGTRFLVLEGADGHAGILADRVDQVVRAHDDLELAPGALGTGSDHIEGLLRRDGRMIIVLDLDGALRVDDRRARETA